MERLTAKNGDTITLREGASQQAVLLRLAQFEALYETLLRENVEFSLALQKLKEADKTKTVKFRELMGKKLMNTQMLGVFGIHGIE